MPTVEWRSPDASLPSQILCLAEEVDTVMEQLHHTEIHVEDVTGEVTGDGITLPEFNTLLDYTEEAIHTGLESTAVAAYLKRMGVDVQGYDPLTRKIDGRDHISVNEARELRLQYGKRLKRDVNHLLQD
ncbi:hypothetical protein [Halalkalicoccus salilacus]|uniref:hypothetical protein n=1 Tax=Halalkalicoccus salilacus TaxID=3117459 RepID=UPI00300F5531